MHSSISRKNIDDVIFTLSLYYLSMSREKRPLKAEFKAIKKWQVGKLVET